MTAPPAEEAAPVLAVDRREQVAWLTLDRPGKHNALDGALIDALCEFFADAATDDELRVIVLRGAGRSFCAGLDLKANLADPRSTRRIVDLMPLMRACPQPIIACIHGYAKGGGLVMALAADLRIAGESARMDDTFIDIGLSGADVGISYFLPRMVGTSVAAELMLTGRAIDAHRAERLGLVMEVVADNDLESTAEAIAADLCTKSRLGLQRTKEILNDALATDDLVATIRREVDTQIEVSTKDPAFGSNVKRFRE